MTTDELQILLQKRAMEIVDLVWPTLLVKDRKKMEIIGHYYGTRLSSDEIAKKMSLSISRIEELRKAGLRLLLHPSRRSIISRV